MTKQKAAKPTDRREMSPVERLGLRVSAMINHPMAQTARKVTVHRLDTDEDREWNEVMARISETDGLERVFSDDGSVTLSWEADEDERVVEQGEPLEEEAAAPF